MYLDQFLYLITLQCSEPISKNGTSTIPRSVYLMENIVTHSCVIYISEITDTVLLSLASQILIQLAISTPLVFQETYKNSWKAKQGKVQSYLSKQPRIHGGL